VTTVTFSVERIWKGKSAKRIQLHSITGPQSVRFDSGTRYVSFAGRLTAAEFDRLMPLDADSRRADFFIDGCSSKRADDVDLSELGSGQTVR
jgi:hypothetical protein